MGGKSFSVPPRSSHGLTVTGTDPDSPAMDGLVIGTSIDGPAATPLKFEGFISAGFNSDGPKVVQMENFLVPPRSFVSVTVIGLDPDSPAMAGLEIGTSSNGLAEALMEFKGTLTAGSNSDGPAVAQLEFFGVNCVDKAGSVSSELLFQGTDNEGTRQIDVENTGTKQIQGIVLEMHEPKNVDWNPEAFSKMRNLKLLKICGVQLMRDLKHLPTSLRILDWRGYPSKSLTSNSQSKSFENLKFIELSESLKLIEAPDIIKVPNLESLVLEDRLPENLGNAESLQRLDLKGTAIRKVPPSIGFLKKLKWLILDGCKGLSSNKLWYEVLPFYSMPTSPDPMDLLLSSLSLSNCASSLTSLFLNDCNLKAISNDISSLFSLIWLDLSGNDFVCLPESIIRLSKLKFMNLNNCTSLRSLPKLPLNIVEVEAKGCISLEMLLDPLKQSDSLEPSLFLQNCFQLADNQSCIDWFILGIKKSLKLSPPLRLLVLKESYNIVIPGSEIPEWFSHQSMGNEVKIKQPSHLNKKVGIAICVVFCTHYVVPNQIYSLPCSLTVNGKILLASSCSLIDKVLSNHLWLVYLTPQFLDKKFNKLLSEGDANGFSQIGIELGTKDSIWEVKKCGLRVIYNKDIEDLDRTMVQYSNSSITPYGDSDVFHHNFNNSAVVVEFHKVKRSHDDCDGAGHSGEGSSNDIPNPKRIKRNTETHGNSDCEESSEYKDCDEELSDCDA
nr:disease resistance protein rps4 [Quercus suber]